MGFYSEENEGGRMKKVLLLMVAVMLIVGLMAGPALADAVTPSTNEDNINEGWAHFNVLEVGPGYAEIQFVSTRSFASCFEYRTDGDTSQASGDNYNGDITDGLYPFTCVANDTETMTLYADEYIEIRMVFGAETDERFDWTRVDVLPAMTDGKVTGGGNWDHPTIEGLTNYVQVNAQMKDGDVKGNIHWRQAREDDQNAINLVADVYYLYILGDTAYVAGQTADGQYVSAKIVDGGASNVPDEVTIHANVTGSDFGGTSGDPKTVEKGNFKIH